MITATEERARPALSGRQRAWLVALFGPALLGPVWALALGGWAPGTLGTWSGVLLLVLAATCAYTDLRWKKIYNWATYSAFLWALLLNTSVSLLAPDAPAESFWARLGAVGLGNSLLGAGLCFAIMLLIYRLSGGGAGDVKLAGAIGGLLGPQDGLTVLVYTYIAAGVVILAWVIWTLGPVFLLKALLRRVGALLWPSRIAPPAPSQQKLLNHAVPLAAFFAIGVVAVLLGGGITW
jgi:prepilin peptidase CpaA